MPVEFLQEYPISFDGNEGRCFAEDVKIFYFALPFSFVFFLQAQPARLSEEALKREVELAGEVKLAMTYLKGEGIDRDYKKASKWLKKAAQKGHAISQYNLGKMYDSGAGGIQDFSLAATWYTAAAKQGVIAAQFNMGRLNHDGHGMVQDLQAAALWYTKAAEQGHGMARNNLGLLYHTGKGVPLNFFQAIKLYSLAADQGIPEAQHNLSLIFTFGKGIEKDLVKAYAWALSARSNGVDNDKFMKMLDKDVSPHQIAKAQVLAGNIIARKKADLEPLDSWVENRLGRE